MEQRVKEIETRMDRMDIRIDKVESTVHQQEIQFAETKVYVKEIYKKLDSVSSTLEYLKTSATRTREDFLAAQSQADASVKIAEARAEAAVVKTEAKGEAATVMAEAKSEASIVKSEARSTGKWQDFYAKAFWVMAGIIITIIIALITSVMHPASVITKP